MRRLLLAALLLGAASPAPAQDRIAALRGTVAATEAVVARLEAQEAVENLQGAWGYYVDKGLWTRAAALFSADGRFEYGQRGVYAGRRRIARAMALAYGAQGPRRLNVNLQMQPYVTVAPDARSALARWRSVQMLTGPDGGGRWGAGVFENRYVLEKGRWKIASIHFYVTFLTRYEQGWQGGNTIAMEGPDAAFPPDAPPSDIYQSLPGAYLPPYHYRNPVTGRSGQWPQPSE